MTRAPSPLLATVTATVTATVMGTVMGTVIAIVMAIVMAIVIVPGLASAHAQFGAPGELVRAPDFELPRVGGGTVSRDDLAGSIVVLYFFRDRCPACRRSHPALRRILEEDRAADVRIVAIDVDGRRRRTTPEVAARLAVALGRAVPVLSGDEKTIGVYGQVLGAERIPGTPTLFVLDRDGFVFHRRVGPAEPMDLMAPIEFLYGVDAYRPDRWNRPPDDRGDGAGDDPADDGDPAGDEGD